MLLIFQRQFKQYDIMTNKEQRDFLLKEIQKRIVGPGFSEEAYLCADDASDEILVNRPQIVYSSGIIFPQTNEGEEDELQINFDSEEDNNVLSSEDMETETIGQEKSSPDSNPELEEEENDELPSAEETNQFNPTHIGLITCLDTITNTVDVEIEYGQYQLVKQENLINEVHVMLGRCTIDKLNETFDYYDKYAQGTLKAIGVSSVRDMFLVDEQNRYVSPKGIFEINEVQSDNSVRTRNVRPGDFPSLLQNKAAIILRKLLNSPNKSQSIEHIISWVDFHQQLVNFSKDSRLINLLQLNHIASFEDFIIYDPSKEEVKTKSNHFNLGDYHLDKLLFVDDPVRNDILEKLLQFRFFKRNKKRPELITINLSDKSKDVNDDIMLIWKIIPSSKNPNHKYLRILMVNKHKKSPKMEATDFIYQAELKVISPHIVSYTEPHHSSIEDKEYEVNEILYSDELVYAKGVNCAATWNIDGESRWVKTTYTPKKDVRSFATSSNDDDVNAACNIFDMTIWSKVSKEEILSRFRKMANAYSEWHKGQKEKAHPHNIILADILNDQEYFLDRINKNIDYLDQNERAYKCFLLANSAMYIQMILSRDTTFSKKGRVPAEFDFNSEFFRNEAWSYFALNKTPINPYYRPFQLAFLLMNVESTFEKDSVVRNNVVDLIWFPTGGGKTEAYLALTALTIAERRTSGYSNVKGVSVIMRYTLRLLTAQQFERASYLICSLEFLRKELVSHPKLGYTLGNDAISIGMWIGQASTPNSKDDLKNDYKYKNFFGTITGNKKAGILPEIPQSNPFPVSYCPWCGCNLVGSIPPNNTIIKGYDEQNGSLHCIMRNCYFKNSLPIDYIDESLYNNPPTLLFATVDKFAQLTKQGAGKLFGVGTGQRKPDLIIQDELHLISGPLGSIVGMFETMVEELCTHRAPDGRIISKPKIIASTATTRNTHHLIKQLYDRRVKTFPVSGVRYDDNFFSRILPLKDSKRLYSGISPTGHTSAELEIRTIAAELVAKEKLIRSHLLEKGVDLNNNKKVINALFDDVHLTEQLDNYWTMVVYYKDLKTLGRAHSRIGQEIYANAMSMRSYIINYPSLAFILNDFPQRTNEFTSRQDSSRIKQLLVEATEATKLFDRETSPRITSKMDIVQATNMISVGIDIARWNVMIMIGQPMTTADYIQASSRVGRTYEGLIINLLNPMRNRELSLYENYESYHQVFYKYVEPLSVTTFTEMTLQKLMANIYLCYMILIRGKKKPVQVDSSDLVSLKDLLDFRCKEIGTYKNFISYMNKSVDKINNFFMDDSRKNMDFFRILNNDDMKERLQEIFPVMSSLRDVESNTFILYE